MRRFCTIMLTLCMLAACAPLSAGAADDAETIVGAETTAALPAATLLYQGHASLRITTGEGRTIYIDPYAGEGYDVPADLILVTHMHSDHDKVKLIKHQNEGCVTITNSEALVDGAYQTFVLGYVTVEAVQAGNNPNHDISVCVGYILTLSDGKTIYISGDTSRTDQMATLAARKLDYAFFCCDGKYNMDAQEAAACADLVGAKHSIPYHTQVGKLFSQKIADQFTARNKLVILPGEEITIE
jgi:L-ascorbate metabolism protein UlaG (beta-lactamase superfamily)